MGRRQAELWEGGKVQVRVKRENKNTKEHGMSSHQCVPTMPILSCADPPLDTVEPTPEDDPDAPSLLTLHGAHFITSFFDAHFRKEGSSHPLRLPL
jgi:hypothetical protein